MTDSQYDLRVWLNNKVNEAGRGVKGKLAEHLGMRPDAITRILNLDPEKESRLLKAHEIEAIRNFFGEPTSADIQRPVPLLSWVSAGALKYDELAQGDFDDYPLIYEQGLDPSGDWIALRVDGRSMDKISPHESIIFVNRKEKNLVPNACYVVSDGNGGATYKRFKSPNIFEPASTKADQYKTISFDIENPPEIIGRVRKSTILM